MHAGLRVQETERFARRAGAIAREEAEIFEARYGCPVGTVNGFAEITAFGGGLRFGEPVAGIAGERSGFGFESGVGNIFVEGTIGVVEEGEKRGEDDGPAEDVASALADVNFIEEAEDVFGEPACDAGLKNFHGGRAGGFLEFVTGENAF